MEQQNKYYTPSIEELHVGYECQLMNRLNSAWEDTKLTGYDIQELYMTEYNVLSICIKSKYLDKEDIERHGWICQEYTQDGYNQSYTKEADSESGYDLIYCATWGGKWQIDYCGQGIYWGEIKSVNELRKIMKMLAIN